MKAKELAYALGISGAMVSRLAKRGMPTHSIEEAEKWRKKHLDTTRTKQHRSDGNRGVKNPAPTRATRPQPDRPVAGGSIDDPLMHWVCAQLPKAIYDPYLFAAAAADAGFTLSGAQSIRLCQHLFISYMQDIDPRDEHGFTVPPRINHPPTSEGFSIEARAIDFTMEGVNRRMGNE